MIGKKSILKGYNEDFITEKIEEVSRLTSDDLIQDKIKKFTPYQGVPIILNDNIQFKQILKIFKKHWPILKTEKQLRTILSEQPKFVYRRAPTLSDIIAKNLPNPPSKSEQFKFFQGKGFFPLKDAMPVEM